MCEMFTKTGNHRQYSAIRWQAFSYVARWCMCNGSATSVSCGVFCAMHLCLCPQDLGPTIAATVLRELVKPLVDTALGLSDTTTQPLSYQERITTHTTALLERVWVSLRSTWSMPFRHCFVSIWMIWSTCCVTYEVRCKCMAWANTDVNSVLLFLSYTCFLDHVLRRNCSPVSTLPLLGTVCVLMHKRNFTHMEYSTMRAWNLRALNALLPWSQNQPENENILFLFFWFLT